MQAPQRTIAQNAALGLHRGRQRLIQIRFDNFRMHITTPTNRRCVAEHARDIFDGLHNIAFRVGRAVELLDVCERECGQHRAGPGAKILGGEILIGNFPQISVNVGGIDSVPRALIIDVLK